MVSPKFAIKALAVPGLCVTLGVYGWMYFSGYLPKEIRLQAYSDTQHRVFNDTEDDDVHQNRQLVEMKVVLHKPEVVLHEPETARFGANLQYKYLIIDYTGYTKNNTDFAIKNCLISQNKGLVGKANAVAITTRKLQSLEALPTIRHRWQRWVWILDESPYHATDGQPFRISQLNHIYNWTMTYRSDSDIHIPYGWVIRKEPPDPEVPDLGERRELVASVITNCNSVYVHNHRMEYVRELQQTTNVTVYGGCGKSCPGFQQNQLIGPCPELRNFLFYLAFENSNCREYITEKMFMNAFWMGAVPVVMGPKKDAYLRTAPPNSFIHVQDFDSPKMLGQFLMSLSKNRTAYMKYHEWRKDYKVHYRVQYVDRDIWEPLCDKLNADTGEEKTISHLDKFWTVSECDSTRFW